MPRLGRTAFVAFVMTLTACSSTVVVSRSGTLGTSGSSTDGTTSQQQLETQAAADQQAGALATPGAAKDTKRAGAAGAGTRAGAKALCTGKVELGASFLKIAAGVAGLGATPDQTAQAQAKDDAQQAMRQAAVDDLNKRGGLAGCQITPVFYSFDPTNDTYDGQSETECSRFAEDHHVFAVELEGYETPTALDCLAKHGIPVIWNVGGANDKVWGADYQKNRSFLYAPRGIFVDRWGPFIDELNAAGYFDPGYKLALMIADDGAGWNQHLVNDIWKPRMKALGIKITDEFTYSYPRQFSDAGNWASQLGSATLQFKTEGIDHVLWAPGGQSWSLFIQAAEQQGLRPRYAFTSFDGAVGGSCNYTRDHQLDRALAVTWLPNANFPRGDFADDTGDPCRSNAASNPPNPAKAACDRVTLPKTGGQRSPAGFCDFLNLLTASLAHATVMSATAMRQGVEQLGTSFVSASTFGPNLYNSSRHDGATSIRMMAFDANAHAFRYTSPPRTIP